MNLTKYRPNRALSLLDDSWDRWFDSFFEDFPLIGSRRPAVDIRENDKEYTMEIELPGMTEKDIEVKIEGNLLTFASKKSETKEEKKSDYVHRERRSFSFSRSFVLPENVNADGISAEFKNGLLTVSVPKTEKSKTKLLDIKVK
jgi:HSP20 family protein